MRQARQIILIIMAAGAAAACVSGQRAHASDPVVLGIEIGRYAYMLTQTAELAPAAAPEPAPDQAAPDQPALAQGAQAAALQSQLVETAFTLNAQRARLCRADADIIAAELAVHRFQRIEQRDLLRARDVQCGMHGPVRGKLRHAQRGQRAHHVFAEPVMRESDRPAR